MGTATLPPPLTKKDFQTDQEVRKIRLVLYRRLFIPRDRGGQFWRIK